MTPYGSWNSPITAEFIVAETVGLSSPMVDGDDIYWLESRPSEGGRNVLVRRTPDGATEDITPEGFNVRSRAHEYGGGAYTVNQGTVYFSNDQDRRIYRQSPNSHPRPLTPESSLRFADLIADPVRRRLICIREEHLEENEPINSLVSLSMDARGDDLGTELATGADFFSTPCLSPGGDHLAWLTWKHPAMPWDGTQLWIAPLLADGSPGKQQPVAGGPEESIFQPQWSPDGRLYFVSDRGGWWNIYRHTEAGAKAIWRMEAEFGLPQWVFGMSTYTFTPEGRLICTYTRNGIWSLAELTPTTGALTPIETPYTYITDLHSGTAGTVFLGGSPTEATAVSLLRTDNGIPDILRREGNQDLDPHYLSPPEAIEFTTGNGLTAHAFYYPPRNPHHCGPTEEQPPLLVRSHGGPTAATNTSLKLAYQYWTSRGFAILDVNYGGSTGYGRDYRQRLLGNWGIVDVEDCVNGARYLVGRGDVDSQRLAIRGSSAGGYTTLAALTFHTTFQAGASLYGVSELESLALDTHKFESRYLDHLIGPYPEGRELYRARSPIHHTDQLSTPVIFFQGLEDQVVPPEQAEKMVEALREKGLPVAYVPFEGEQHGFRKAPNIKRALEAELFFYSRVFGFEPADPVEPVVIENL
ncbi:MAG: S9 family peptidase [Gammaproteobacteria bacterium]|nr:S9 family peptidase [Gammaproteobacteria bacterium]